MKKKNSFGRLRSNQKIRFYRNILITVGKFYQENNRMPETEQEIEEVTQRIYKSAGLKKLAYKDCVPVVQKKLPGVIHKILTEGVPQKKVKKVKTEAEKKAIKERKRQRRLEKKLRKQMEEESMTVDRDDTFYYIEGYTSWGFPYGVTWEEMGLEPWQDEDDLGKAK